MFVCNIFHYYKDIIQRKRKGICKVNHVQGIMLAHSVNSTRFMLKYEYIYNTQWIKEEYMQTTE